MAGGQKNYFIAVTGIMGSGKTTVCDLLARELDLHFLKEPVEGNAFLPLFYKDPVRWALSLQLFYLGEGVDQLEKVKSLLAEIGVVQDYFLHHSFHVYGQAQQILARLADEEFSLYQKFFDALLTRSLPQPDFIINLEASLPVLKERIQKRARDFEQEVDTSYLEILCKLQQEWITGNQSFHVVSVNTDELDLAKNGDHQREFVKMVESLMRH